VLEIAAAAGEPHAGFEDVDCSVRRIVVFWPEADVVEGCDEFGDGVVVVEEEEPDAGCAIVEKTVVEVGESAGVDVDMHFGPWSGGQKVWPGEHMVGDIRPPVDTDCKLAGQPVGKEVVLLGAVGGGTVVPAFVVVAAAAVGVAIERYSHNSRTGHFVPRVALLGAVIAERSIAGCTG